MRKLPTKKGEVLVLLLVILFVFAIITTPIINAVVARSKVLNSTVTKEQALHIAEAGVNYYQWHLAHFTTDYKDGTSSSGPYVHTYTDYDNQKVLGQFSLVITPPTTGSTIVTIKSTGSTVENPNIKRTITARYGVPSLAKYAFVSNAVIWIGSTETINGQMASNSGIRFDGVGNAPIQSTRTTYSCSSTQGSPCPATKNGVWGSATQTTKNFWQFPVPAVDFSSLTTNFAAIKSGAQSAGIYLPPSSTGGYSLAFNNTGTVSIYKVTKLKKTPTGWDVNGNAHAEDIDYDTKTFLYTKTIPTNGLIYIEDNVWVEGIVKGRVVVATAKLPYNASQAPTIYIPNNITYLTKDGTNSLGLIAQKDVVITYGAPSVLEIDAAIVAQNGSAQIFNYSSACTGNCSNVIKNSITTYGSIMSYGQWTWSWISGSTIVSGYPNTYSTYDNNLLYAPPPSFPLSASGYQLISWSSD